MTKTTTTTTKTTPEHRVAYDDLVDLVAKHAGEVSPTELVVLAANMVGKNDAAA